MYFESRVSKCILKFHPKPEISDSVAVITRVSLILSFAKAANFVWSVILPLEPDSSHVQFAWQFPDPINHPLSMIAKKHHSMVMWTVSWSDMVWAPSDSFFGLWRVFRLGWCSSILGISNNLKINALLNVNTLTSDCLLYNNTCCDRALSGIFNAA
jgi:hypothetical protein